MKSRWGLIGHYLWAPATVALGLAIRLMLNPVLGQSSPFMYFFVSILVSGWLGGLGPALLATILSVLAVDYYYLEPIQSILVSGSREWIQFASFIIIGAIVSVIVSRLRLARERSESGRREALLNEIRYRAIYEYAEIGIERLDESGRLLEVNPALCRMLGYTSAELLSRTFVEITHPDDVLPDVKALERLKRHEVPSYKLEKRYLHQDGHPIWVRLTSSLAPAGAGFFRMSLVEDISARLQVEEALRKSEAQLKTIVESLSEGLIVSDLVGNLIHWNQAALEMHGYASMEECRRRLPDFQDTFELATLEGEFLPVERWPMARVLNGEILRDWDVRVTRPGTGMRRVFSYSGTMVRDDRGQALMAVMTVSDVTERRQIQEDLERHVTERTMQLQESFRHLAELNDKLETSNRELQDFAFVASHDLQEPLRKVMAFGDCLAADYSAGLGETGADFLRRMQSAASRMQTLISDLLQFSRVTTKAQPASRVELRQVVGEVLSDLETRLQQSGGSVEVGELPAIEADALQMRQLLQNLIGNAIKFARPGIPPAVRVYAETEPEPTGDPVKQENHRLRLYVKDNGIGFEEKYLDRIFTVFQRLHERGAYEGTGIGLAICRKIAERHGGSITAHSSPGEGSVFVVTLPYRQKPKDGERKDGKDGKDGKNGLN